MNICERDLERAVKAFLYHAGIPRPERWSKTNDDLFVHNRIYPAMLKALEAIETVNLCYGFDIDRIETRLAEIHQAERERLR